MARKPRIEYPGAVYHVMNRGDRGGKIFKDRLDYDSFLRAVSEVCERTGWKIHGYVLMPNHFHWLLETPEANLVAGMKWFLGAYSQRFNARHGQRGHVFQGRYKALPIESGLGGYFEVVSTYIHLNPARAGLILGKEEGLKSYKRSSYPLYLSSKGSRPEWLEVRRVLGNLELKDDRKGRRAYGRYMEGRCNELRRKAGKEAYKKLWKPIRYGWYVGSEEFAERLIKKLTKTVKGRLRESYEGKAIKRHDESEAEDLVRVGLKVLDLGEDDLAKLPKGDVRKCVLAWLAHTRSLVSHKWLSERLVMGCSSNMPHYINRVRLSKEGQIYRMRRKAERAIPE